MRYSDKIGRLLRSAREARGYSQEYLAEMLEISQSAYANLELAKSGMSVDRLLQICEVLELDVHCLLDQAGAASLPPVVAVAPAPEGDLHPALRDMYEMRIRELRSEIEFLRGLVNMQHAT